MDELMGLSVRKRVEKLISEMQSQSEGKKMEVRLKIGMVSDRDERC